MAGALHRTLRPLAVAAGIAGLTAPATADSVWTGASADLNFSNPLNWLFLVTPDSLLGGGNLQFGGGATTTPFNDYADLAFRRIHFLSDAPSFTIGGNSMRLVSPASGFTSVLNESGRSQTIRLLDGEAIRVAGTQTWTAGTGLLIDSDIAFVSGEPDLLFRTDGGSAILGQISGDGGLAKHGNGLLNLGAQNTYSGATSIVEGTLGLTVDNALAGTGSPGRGVTIGNGAKLDINTSTQQLNGLTGSGEIVSNGGVPGARIVVNNSNFAGTISGLASVEFRGGNRITGSNTFSGGAVIREGATLEIRGDSGLGADGVPLVFNALAAGGRPELRITENVLARTDRTFVFSTDATINLSAPLAHFGGMTGDGGLLKNGAARLTLAGTATVDYAGETILNGGSITLGADERLPDGTRLSFLSNFASFELNGFSERIGSLAGALGVVDTGASAASTLRVGGDNSSTTYGGRVIGAGRLVKEGDGEFRLTGANTVGVIESQDGVLSFASASNLGAAHLVASGGAFANAAAATIGNHTTLVSGLAEFKTTTDLTHQGQIDGAGTLFKSGAGILTLTGQNTHQGGTQVTEGALRIASDASLGGGQLTLGGLFGAVGTLRNDVALATDQATTLQGNNLFGGGGGGIFETNADLTHTGVLDGLGFLLKKGAGTLKLSGANTYLGGTEVFGGTIEVADNSGLGAATRGVTFHDGTALRTTSGFATSRAMALADGAVTFDTAAGEIVHSGGISGAGALVKEGAGTLTLVQVAGQNRSAWTGGTTIREGVLHVDATTGPLGGLGGLPGPTTIDGGAIAFTGTAMFMPTLQLGATGGALQANGTSVMVLREVSGSGQLVKTGDGALFVSLENGPSPIQHSGGTLVKDGALIVNSNGALVGQFGTGGVTLDGGTLQVQGNMGFGFNPVTIGAGNGRIELNDAADLLAINSLFGDSGILLKYGAGQLHLGQGAAGYGGHVWVVEGLLTADSGGVGTNHLNIFQNARATLGGMQQVDLLYNAGALEAAPGGLVLTGEVRGGGSLHGAITFNGVYAPGASPALVTGDTIVFGAGNTLVMELGGLLRGAQYDAIDADDITLGGILDIDLLDLGLGLFAPQLGDMFDLLVAEILSGAFADILLPALSGGLVWRTDIVADAYSGGRDAFRLSVVQAQQPGPAPAPEPAALGLLVLSLGGLAALRRRR